MLYEHLFFIICLSLNLSLPQPTFHRVQAIFNLLLIIYIIINISPSK